MADRLLGITATQESDTAADYMHAARWQAAESGTVTELRVYCGTSGNVKIAVYDDNSGVPGNRLAYDDSGQSVTAGAWRTLTISEFDVTQGEYYHIVHVIDTAGAVRRNNQAATGDRRYAASTYSTHTWPASLSGTSWSTADTAICSDAWGDIAGLSITDVDSDYGASSEEFDVDEDDLDIDGSGFEASQGTGTVYLADESTLAASDAEVDLDDAIQTWSDTTINLDLTALGSTELAAIESLISSDGHSLYIIVENDSAEENYIAVTVHRAKAFGLAASTYIAASGENTTARLTAPSGKTTGDFDAGRIQDDENPCDAIDITDDDYTEIEWCIEALAGSIDGETYQFRLLFDGAVIDTYTVTPEVTISTSSAISGTISISATPSAAIQATGALSATSTLSLTPTADIKGTGNISGTSSIDLTLSGNIEAQGELSGIISISMAPTGDCKAVGGLSGTTSISLTPSALLEANGTLSGTSTIAITQSGNLQGKRNASGTIDISLTPSGLLTSKSSLSGTIQINMYPLSNKGICSGTICSKFSNWEINGLDEDNSDFFILYGTASDVIGNQKIDLYKDSGRTQLVATGQGNPVFPPNGMQINISESGGSGLSGSVWWTESIAVGNNTLDFKNNKLRAKGSLSGSSSISIVCSGDLNAQAALSGTIDVSLTPTGDCKGAGELSGISDISFIPTGNIKGTGSISGTSTISLIPSGVLISEQISGAIAFSLTPTGACGAKGSLSGSITIDLSPTAAIISNGELSGTSLLQLIPTGNCNGKSSLSGTTAISLDPSGDLKAKGNVSGSTSISLIPSGNLVSGAISGTISVSIAPTGDCKAVGSLSGTTSITITPSGNCAGKADISGSSSISLVPTGNCVGKTIISGTSTIEIIPFAALQGKGSLISLCSISLIPSGACGGQGSLTSVVNISLIPSGDISAASANLILSTQYECVTLFADAANKKYHIINRYIPE